MKHINNFKLFESGKKSKSDDSNKDVYAILTKELLDRKYHSPAPSSKLQKQKPISFVHDAYHLKFDSKVELKKLEHKYPVGGKYRKETIIYTALLDSKTIDNR